MRSFLFGFALGPPLLALVFVCSSGEEGSPLGAAPRSRGPRASGELPGSRSAAVARLRARGLILPVEGLAARHLRDTFAEPRGARAHEGIDIPAPRGTPVRAVEDGVVVRLVRGGRGGLSVYLEDGTARYLYYYAHLDAYAPGLRDGASLRRGDLVGYVGSTGNARGSAPHLHFAIFARDSGRPAGAPTPVNPFLVFASGRGGGSSTDS